MASGLLAKLAEAIGLNLFADGVSNTRQGQQFQQEYVDPFMQKGADFFNQIIPSAAAAETPAPVVDRSRPAPSIDQVFANPPAYNPRPSSALPAGRSTPMMPGLTEPYYPGGTTTLPPSPGIATDDVSAQGINQDMAGFAKTASTMSDYINSDATAPITDEEFESLVKNAVMFNSKVDMDPEFRSALATSVGNEGPSGKTGQEIDFNKKIGSIWDSTFGDEEWRLRKAMVINSMRLNPDAALTQAFASRIKDLRKRKGANAMADRLELVDAKKYATLITGLRNGDLEAKDVISTVYKAPTSLEQKLALFKKDPKTAQEMAAAGLFGAEPTGMKVATETGLRRASKAIETYQEAGKNSAAVFSAMQNLDSALSKFDQTGPWENRKAQFREFFAGLGFSVDEDRLADEQTARAATREYVLNELRKNKGPQTNFDATYQEDITAGLGVAPDANKKIIGYQKSVSRLNTIYADLADDASLLKADEIQPAIVEINKLSRNTPAVIKAGDRWVTFNDWYNNARFEPELAKMTDKELLQEWRDLYNQFR